VIAQESLEYGWHEAIVLDRKGDTFILQYRDYPLECTLWDGQT